MILVALYEKFLSGPMTMRRTLCFEEHPFGPLFTGHKICAAAFYIQLYHHRCFYAAAVAVAFVCRIFTHAGTDGRQHPRPHSQLYGTQNTPKKGRIRGDIATPEGHAENILSRYWRDILRIFQNKITLTFGVY